MYILQTQVGNVRGCYDSERTLRLAVDYWMKKYPDQTLSFEKWETNYIPEPMEWDWVYIAPESDTKKLGAGGGLIPNKKHWGKNLVGIKWELV